MFSLCRQTHPATSVEHAVSCCFFNSEETCLVTAGANIIKVFRLMPEGHSRECNAAGQPVPPKMKLECLANYTLWGNVMSMQTVKSPTGSRDLLLLSFREAKLSVVQYDPATDNLVTVSMHYFEEDDMKAGRTQHPYIPWLRVDPEYRCAVMLLYGRRLAALPLRTQANTEETETADTKPLDIKTPTPATTTSKAPILASYVITLKDLDEKIDNIIDIQFLHGYYEPTLLILYEPVRTFAGRTAVRNDTCAMVGVSINLQQRVHPIIWSISGLPFDCSQAVPIQKPLGGCLILAVNSLIYLNQSIPPFGVSLNSIANHTTNFPLRIQEGVSMSADGACVATIGEGRLALSLKSGQLYVLTLISDSVRSVRSFNLERAASSVLTSCMCVVEEDFLFLGSRLGNSLLLRVTERENRMLLSLEKPLENTIDLTDNESEQQTPSADQSAAKKRRLDSLSDCIASNVTEISDRDELQMYGSDIRTTTQLTSYVLEVCDSLLNIGPIGEVSMGEPQLLSEEFTSQSSMPLVELVCTSGYGKNGALTVLQRSVRPQLLTTFNLPGCIDMWTVFGEPPEVVGRQKEHQESDGLHSYMLLTQEETTMVLQTGQEINEVDNSGYMTQAPTVFAGNLGANRYSVQVTTISIRLIKGSQQVQNITLDWTAASATVADPYLCVVSTCGKALVLALRESKGMSMAARLAPTRQAVPNRPSLLKACAYRDLSGMFTSTMDASQVKGEFTGKMKGKKEKNVKAEGFRPDTVYEINEEDELLYGGDQTPASMATIMLEELTNSEGAGVPRRLSRWWKKYLIEHKPTYWLFVVRDNGNLEIYSLPEMRLSFLVRDVAGGARVLADSLESVSMLMGLPNSTEELQTHAQGHGSTVDLGLLKEILMVGLGDKGSRPLLLIRMQNEIMVYQVYKYPKGHLKMRFSRVPVTWSFGYSGAGDSAADVDSYEVQLIKENMRRMRYFGNIAGYNGVFICGETPYMLLLSPRGEIRAHPLAPEDGAVATFAPFNNPNCPQGFLYFNSQSELRICALPTHLSYDAPWPVRKVPLRVTPHFVTFHLESKTYCLVASSAAPTTSYYKFNGEDKELSAENKGDRFPYPLVERFSVMLFSPVSWEVIPNTKMQLDEWEHVTCFKNVALSYAGTRSGLRGYIALGTNYNYGEDITSRGRIVIYDIIDVVPEPGQPLTKNRFKEVYAKEQKGPVTALTDCCGFLVAAIGQKIYLWQLKDDDLVGVAFIDTQIYVHRMLAVKNIIVIADVYKSVSLLRYQESHRTLSLVARDMRNTLVYELQLMVDNTNLGFIASEIDSNLVLLHYQPMARESYGGTRLLRKADYHLGQQVHTMFRIMCKKPQHSKDPTLVRRHITMFATLDGGLGYVLPVSEKTYRRLLMLQNVMNNFCCHIGGLNPKAWRTYTGNTRRGACVGGSGPARSILDGDLVFSFLHLSHADRQDIAKKIGTKVEEVFADLNEIDRQTSHF